MGCTASVKTAEDRPTSTFRPIPDRFTTIAQVQQAVRKAGLESSNLILGVDFTKSNKWTGAETFGGRCLHATNGPPNPYHRVIDVIGRTLEDFDDDRLIPAFGFGDAATGDQACFPFAPDGPITGVSAVLERYTEIAQQVALAGPTSFAPVIRQAIDIVREERGYHILVIVADGQVTDASPTGPTAQAIIEASDYPLSIVVVGVGDGPWDAMEHYDDELPQRRFDNFQFVDFNRISRGTNADAQFALHALMEVPDQYKFIKDHGLLSSPAFSRPAAVPPAPLAPSPATPRPTRSQVRVREFVSGIAAAAAPTQVVAPPLDAAQVQVGPSSSRADLCPRTVPAQPFKLVPKKKASKKAVEDLPPPPDYTTYDHFRSVQHLAAPPAAEWY